MTTRRKIESDSRVDYIEPFDDEPYKWTVVLKAGYRVVGYHSHIKNIERFADFDPSYQIEECPDDCYCKKEQV